MTLPRVYPIVDVGSLIGRGLEVRVVAQQLVEAGAEILQLRCKDGSPQEILRYAEEISQVVDGTGCLPVMNDRVDLAILAGWRAVHLGHKDLPPEAARQVFGRVPAVLGVSTHDAAQVAAANASTADYVAIGPVFGTATKADAEPVVGLEGVRMARGLTRKPLVAIGGITAENAVEVIAAGADSVAVIGALYAGCGGVRVAMEDILRRLR